MNTESENKKILAALTSAVSDALDKKRRLEQYAVIWRDGKPAVIKNNDEKLITKGPVNQK